MKITGGEAKGRNIVLPPGKDVRPTASKMRQALFNIIARRVEGSSFLDVFAGSGLMGMEALSRGASSLVQIEQNKQMAQAIQKSAELLGYRSEVLSLDFRQAFKLLSGRKFDIIFADPPYKTNFAQSVLHGVNHQALLEPDGILIIEHLFQTEFDLTEYELEFVERRKYGQSAFSFWCRKANGSS
jgi:16S rRNA (guanine(966)-N(2))-methyltransferase RsmD